MFPSCLFSRLIAAELSILLDRIDRVVGEKRDWVSRWQGHDKLLKEVQKELNACVEKSMKDGEGHAEKERQLRLVIESRDKEIEQLNEYIQRLEDKNREYQEMQDVVVKMRAEEIEKEAAESIKAMETNVIQELERIDKVERECNSKLVEMQVMLTREREANVRNQEMAETRIQIEVEMKLMEVTSQLNASNDVKLKKLVSKCESSLESLRRQVSVAHEKILKGNHDLAVERNLRKRVETELLDLQLLTNSIRNKRAGSVVVLSASDLPDVDD
jgi:hypothetical protein